MAPGFIRLARFKNIETKWKYANQGEVKKSLSHFYPIFLLNLQLLFNHFMIETEWTFTLNCM